VTLPLNFFSKELANPKPHEIHAGLQSKEEMPFFMMTSWGK
jgi:hypothetical protein